MEQRLAIPLATFDFTAVCAIELPVPFRTALRFEIFRRIDLFGEVINALPDGLVGLRIGGLRIAERVPVSTNLFFIHVRRIVARGRHRRFIRCLGLCFFLLRFCQYTSCRIIGCLGGLIVLDFLDIFVGCIIDIRIDRFLRRIISDLVLQRIFCRGESGFRMCLGVLRRSCLLLRRLIRRMRGTHRRHLVLLLFRRSLIFLDGLQHSVLGSGHAFQHGLRFVILRLRAGVDLNESPVRRAIAQPLLDHLAFDERNLCLIRCLRRRIADVICEFFLELSKALRERFRRHLLLAQSESDITLCRDTGLPCSVFVFPADGDGLISMDARLGFAIQRCRSLGRHFGFPDGTTFSAEDFTHLVHPVLHFTRTGGFRLARCRLEIDVPVSKERTIHRKSCVRGNFREGILLRGNRDRGRIQDIALRLDIQLTDCSRGVSTRGDADVALRGFCLAAKGGLRLSIIGHIIRRTGVTCRAKDIDHRGAREFGIIFAADTDRAAAIGLLIRLVFGIGQVFILVLFLDFFRIAREETCALCHAGRSFRCHVVRILHVSRTDRRAGRDDVLIFRSDMARGVDGNGVLIEKRLACRFFRFRQRRRIRMDRHLPEVDGGRMPDGRFIHNTGTRRESCATARRRLCFLRLVFRENAGFVLGLNGRVIAYGYTHVRGFREACLAARAAVVARRDGFHRECRCALVYGGNVGGLAFERCILADGYIGMLIQVHTDISDGTGYDTTAAGNGMGIDVLPIRRLRHFRFERECFARGERRAIPDRHMRTVIRGGHCHRDPHACEPDSCRGRERRNLRCILCRDREVSPGIQFFFLTYEGFRIRI